MDAYIDSQGEAGGSWNCPGSGLEEGAAFLFFFLFSSGAEEFESKRSMSKSKYISDFEYVNTPRTFTPA